jgi:hypothetical protein
MSSFFGIPAHPLFVHIPAVLLPLAAVGVVMMVIRPSWHQRYRWAVLAIGFVGTVGAILAASAGESLEEQIVAKEGRSAAAGWEDDVEAGETARMFAIVFFIVLAAFILVPWFLERRRAQASGGSAATGPEGSETVRAGTMLPRWATIGLAVLVLAGSAGTVVTVILAGHSGAKAVWCEVETPPNCDGG